MGSTGDKIAPPGYNPCLETDCRNEIGPVREPGTIRIESTRFNNAGATAPGRLLSV